MPQKLKQTVLTTFSKGLITEVSPLSFPPDASIDELNCDLFKSIPRRRRKGFGYESSNVLIDLEFDSSLPIHTQVWTNYSQASSGRLVVVQHGSTLYFFDSSVQPVSNQRKNFTVDLTSYIAGNSYDSAVERISAASVDGKLIVVSKAINPISVTYDDDSDTISVSEITCRIRDFEWQGDRTTYLDNLTSANPGDGRKYDTGNTGWVETDGTGNDVRLKFGVNVWPKLTAQWYVGKDATDGEKFNSNLWTRGAIGTQSLIGNGRYILDLWDMDRNAASDYISSDALNEPETNRFSCTASFGGRAWFAGIPSQKNGTKVFFSQVIYNNTDFGEFLQKADPTAENDSDLVDSDGGVINITGAGKIRQLFPWGPSLLVFADNGVWEIKGVDNVFKATAYAVTRVPNTVGIANIHTLVDADGTPIYWSHSGIAAISRNDVGDVVGQDISKETIQTFWDDIGSTYRNYASGVFDEYTKRVYWMYGDDVSNYYKYNNILILDTTLQAFIPWRVTDKASNTDYITAGFYFDGRGQTTAETNVIDLSSSTVITTSSATVTVSAVSETLADAGMKFFVAVPSLGQVTVGEFNDSTDWLDWGTRNYSSYAEAGYVFDDSLSFKKNNIYVTSVFKRTEDGWTGSESTGYVPTNESRCTLKSYWDFNDAVTSSQEAYRLLTMPDVDPAALGTFDYPKSNVITKLKIRGRGRVLKLRWESQQGYDFQLYGYEVINASNTGF